MISSKVHLANRKRLRPPALVRRTSRTVKHRPATSLLEVVITMSVGTLMFILLAQVTGNVLASFRRSSGSENATSKANEVLDTMTRIIRQAQPSPTGAYPLVSATGTSLSFFASTTSSGQINQVRFTLQGSTIQYGEIQPTGSPPVYNPAQEIVTTILTNVQNGAQPLFDYYGSAFTGGQAPMSPIVLSTIRLVQVTIIYDPKPNEPPAASTLRFYAQLRNLKDNY